MLSRSPSLLLLLAFACRREPAMPAVDHAERHAAASRPSSSAAEAEAPGQEVEPEKAPPAMQSQWPPAGTGATSDFCIDGVSALDESSCYALPDAPTQELLIYFHGIVPPTSTSPQKPTSKLW